jgi:uncharacterized membrane protein
VATLIAIAYPDETTATTAADEARRHAKDLLIQPDAVAVIIREKEGDYHVERTHRAVGIGSGTGALMGRLINSGINKKFRDQMQDMVKPGTSTLLLMLEKATPGKVIEAMSKYGGTVLKTFLSEQDEDELQEALQGGHPR